ncbi:hypothetical protein AB0G73_33240 [Streptomyces sp. NPDC020719]|uniref:hypothetical protein n=1 Tax=Streptomyces sp. NPDC020719 TaxID=3154896 RepID=UPI0033EC75E0
MTVMFDWGLTPLARLGVDYLDRESGVRRWGGRREREAGRFRVVVDPRVRSGEVDALEVGDQFHPHSGADLDAVDVDRELVDREGDVVVAEEFVTVQGELGARDTEQEQRADLLVDPRRRSPEVGQVPGVAFVEEDEWRLVDDARDLAEGLAELAAEVQHGTDRLDGVHQLVHQAEHLLHRVGCRSAAHHDKQLAEAAPVERGEIGVLAQQTD